MNFTNYYLLNYYGMHVIKSLQVFSSLYMLDIIGALTDINNYTMQGILNIGETVFI